MGGEAARGDEAIAQAVSLTPDVVTMDLKMPGMDGISATREMKQRIPDVNILVLTLYADDFVGQAIEAGASGYLLKDSDSEQIAAAVRQVAEGLCPIAPSLTRELMKGFAELSRSSQASRLTGRQVEILKLIAEGLRCEEICRQLWVSTSTVKREMRDIRARLQVSDRAQAVAEGIRQGII